MNAQRVEIIRPDWLKTREFRSVHRRNPDPRWWAVVDGIAKPGPLHYEIVNFVVGDDAFRFVGFDIDPAAAFVVTNFSVGGVDVDMGYPFHAHFMMPRPGKRPVLIPPNAGVCITLRNERREVVPFTVRILEPRDIR